jgi:hypothetical protein
MKRKFLTMTFITSLIFLWGCYPDGVEYYEETDIVYTNYVEKFDFKSKGTYSMPDQIVKLTGNLVEGEDPEFVKEPYNTQVITKIKENMTKMGYTYVDTQDATEVDLVLLPSVLTNTTIYYYYDYWCWYYPYYCGWGYGWYYPSYSTVTTGTLLMTLISDDDQFVEPTNVWTAAANGLMSGYGDVTRINNAIDQAFKQSPYLNTK